MWKTAVSGAVAISAITACAGIVFAGLAFTQGGAEISFRGLHITMPAQTQMADVPSFPTAPDPPVLPPAPPPPPPAEVAPIAQFGIPYLGIMYRQDMQQIEGRHGPVDVNGASVVAVYPGTPASGIDLRSGDMILAVDGEPLLEGLDLRNAVRSSRVGASIMLDVYRDDRVLRMPVTLGALPLGLE
jgi:S1-C subfamily serine protease